VSATMTVLAVGFQWRSPHMLGAALLVGVLIVLAVGLLYPAQVKVLPAVWRFTLPGLRCAALVALAMSLARPVAQRPLAEEEQGAVVVLVDASRSMDVRDNQRTPAMLVALADGMGRLPAGARSHGEAFATIAPDLDRLSGLLATITQAQTELGVAQLQGKENPQARVRLRETAAEFTKQAKAVGASRARLKASQPMTGALSKLEHFPPLKPEAVEEEVVKWAARAEGTIADVSKRAAQFQTESDEALYDSDSRVKRICDEIGGLTRFGLVERALTDPDAGLLAHLPAKAPLFGYTIGETVAPLALRGAGGENVRRLLGKPDDGKSDLTGGLREAMERLRYQPIQSVVLFSDGRQVGADTSIASSLIGGSSVKVYTVCPAPPSRETPVHDLAIARVTMPQSLFIGETLNVQVEMKWNGLKGKQTQVTLEVGPERQQRVVKEGDKSPVRFSVRVNEAGPQRVTVTAAPLDGEISTENNVATRWVKVLSDRFDVLLAGGSASWDFRYLRNALSRTRWINSKSVLLTRESPGLGLTPAQILTQDVIVLDDVPAKALSGEQWEAVRTMVARRGGSVILIAGQEHLPREYTGEFLSEFLPYRRSTRRDGGSASWRTWPGEEPEFRVVPAPRTAIGDVLSLDDNAAVSADRWIELPPIFRFLAMPELKDLVQPLLVERGTGAPLLTRQRLGRGKVFFLGVDETWRWRYKVGERDQDRFFQQLVRAAADEPFAVSNGTLSFDADRVTIAPDEAVHVRGRVADPSTQPPGRPGMEVDVLKADYDVLKSQTLQAVGEADSGRYEGTIGGLPAGEYRLRARGPDGSELEYPLHVASSAEAEMTTLAPDEDLLRRLSDASGGEFRTLDDFQSLAGQLSARREQAPNTAELRLWSSWYLYAFVLACLGAEWSLRKRLGLS